MHRCRSSASVQDRPPNEITESPSKVGRINLDTFIRRDATSAIRMHELQFHTATQMNCTHIVLSKRNKTHPQMHILKPEMIRVCFGGYT